MHQLNDGVLKIFTAPVFAPLLNPARYKGAHGGRGSGKSHFYAESCVERALANPKTRIVCLREVQKSLRESVKLLIEDKIEAMGIGSSFNVLHDRIVTPGDGVITFIGMNDQTADSVKSLAEFDIAYIEEAQSLTSRSLELLRPTIRKPGSEIWAAWNPRAASDPIDQFFRGPTPPPDSICVRANYSDNPFFPDVLEQERQWDQVNRPDRYAHIWDGEYEPTAIGAIWNRANINETRRSDIPPMTKIGVAVDHAVTDTDASNEHGIVVGGIGEDGEGYLLEDASRTGTPTQWATQAVAMFDKYEADYMVVEVNQGGDLVKHTLQTIRPDIPIHEVRATRGKHVRAEPIASMYQVGKIHHVGAFPELEDQMCQMTTAGYQGDGSPDRVDAMVWLWSELFPRIVRRPKVKREFVRQYAPTSTGWLGA